jgi:hydrogenase-4 component B
MQAAMGILALLCLGIGIWPEPFVSFAFLGTRSLNLVGEVSPDLFVGLARNISLGAVSFLGILLLATCLRRGLYAGKPVERGPTWGCGFTRPTVRMQYTGTSYAMSMVGFFRPFVRVRNVYSGIRKVFPGRTTFENEVEDLAEYGARRMLVAPFFRNIEKLRWIQHGKIQLYIAYIVVAIIVLLLTL